MSAVDTIAAPATGLGDAGMGDAGTGESGTVSSRSSRGVVFDTQSGPHLFLANGSRIYQVTKTFAKDFLRFEAANDSDEIDRLLVGYGLDAPDYIENSPPPRFAHRSISLAVAQKCNLGCTYCYAQGGSFGAKPKNMSQSVAFRAVENLIAGVPRGERANIAFLGGEPLVNRAVIHEATEYAVERAQQCGVTVSFSITTNGTLLRPEDSEFFERHGFAVTISLDGIGSTHDTQRPYLNGRGSYDRIMKNIMPLLKIQHAMQVSARVTVTPHNLCLEDTLEEFISLGFHSVGFSPMLSAPTGRDEMGHAQLEEMLDQMIACGKRFEQAVVEGRRYSFLNMLNAIKEIHKGTHRPYACGAGAGYLGVSSDGDYAACHRFVNEPSGAMGDIYNGPDEHKRSTWMKDKHVHFQSPCSQCWARYLCGGGCAHEVHHRGRPSCDYIRGWLTYCLGAYIRLLRDAPDHFGDQR